mgnify:CR=1 FL=1
MGENKWVELARVHGDLQAELLRGLLEAQDIPVILSQEGAGRAIGLTVGPMGEVRILVASAHIGQARRILDQYQAGDFEDQG